MTAWHYFIGPTLGTGLPLLGAIVIILGALNLLCGLAGGDAGPLRALAREASLAPADGLVCGLAVALALGLLAGVAFNTAQHFLGGLNASPPESLPAGLWLGMGGGSVLGFSGGRLPSLPRGLAPGLAVGLVVGLAVFRLIFGPTAGFGPEVGLGVGDEVGLVFGLVGGLCGALAGSLLGGRATGGTAGAQSTIRWSWVVGGLALGLGVAALLEALSLALGWSLFMLPYVAQIPFVQPQPSALDELLGAGYGLGLFGLVGALTGGLAGVLAQSATRNGRTTSHWLGLTPGLLGGLLLGLSVGLSHRIVGGPAIPGRMYVPPDYSAGEIGLAGGLVAGLAGGIALALLLAWTRQRPDRRLLAFGAVTLVLGVIVLLSPFWFYPLFFLDVP
jgi:hypothetical protein